MTATKTPKINPAVAKIASELQALQRQRTVLMKSRIMQANRLQAVVAGTLGYSSGLGEKERLAKFAEATAVIEAVLAGEQSHQFDSIIRATDVGLKAFGEREAEFRSAMERYAKLLPVAAWVQHPDQRGFGLPSLATVIGETGDLAGYANPAKVWRRMGCAPFTSDSQVKGPLTRMGSTWRSGKEGKLHASEWEDFGYSPRRRSIAYVIGEGLVKQNGPGPYRSRYVEAKVRAHETHPEWDWKPCDKCKGTGKEDGKPRAKTPCGTCGGTGAKCKRAHLHGMLLATKRLLLNLWVEWNRG